MKFKANLNAYLTLNVVIEEALESVCNKWVLLDLSMKYVDKFPKVIESEYVIIC